MNDNRIRQPRNPSFPFPCQNIIFPQTLYQFFLTNARSSISEPQSSSNPPDLKSSCCLFTCIACCLSEHTKFFHGTSSAVFEVSIRVFPWGPCKAFLVFLGSISPSRSYILQFCYRRSQSWSLLWPSWTCQPNCRSWILLGP